MCGIAGVVDPDSAPDRRRQVVQSMCDAMVHRGPDDAGVQERGPATLGMRRLAIFDPAHGHQPMSTDDGRFTLVFNGAIYNHRELRAELAASGWPFRTRCDTEVLLAAFARHGAACLGRLRGMFAFAVWDAQERELFLARDPFGIKPLYFTRRGGRFAFASETRALLAAGLAAPALDPVAAADYLAWLAVPAPRTIHRDISSLRPGEAARFRHGELALERTWRFPARTPDTAGICRTREGFVRELRARLEDTIRAHLLADVPVGAFLSGGLDSTAIVALMARASGARLKTFSIGFTEAAYSEADAAAETARHLGTEHHAEVVQGAAVAAEIETLLGSLDQPTGDAFNTFYASRAARAGGVKAALSGLGGDELFGGYPSFRDTARLERWLPAWRSFPPPLRRSITRRLARGDTRQRKLADVLRHARTLHQVAALQRRVFSDATRERLLHPDVPHASNGPFHPEWERLPGEVDDSDTFATVSAWELRTYMADVLLRDSDVMSMAHSLELRVPFVDRPLVEWLWQQPDRFKRDRSLGKSALRDAVRDLLPPGLLERRKRGFTLPLAVWMKRELRPFLEETFAPGNVGRTGVFCGTEVQNLWRRFIAGQDTREWSRLWSMAVLVSFAARRAPVPPAPAPVSLASQPPALRGGTLLLAPEIFASEGGIARILQLHLRAVRELSQESGYVRLVALNDRQIPAAAISHPASGLLAVRACARSRLRFVAGALELARDCDRLICGHVAQLPVAWLARQLNPRLRYYLVAHGIEVWRPFTTAERVALRGAERVLCVSDYTRRELLRHCPLPDGRAIVLPNALDPSFDIRAGRPLAGCPPVILTVTRLTFADRYKGVDHLIAALPAIRAAIPDATLRIVGRGDDVPRLESLARAAGVASAVTFTGYLPDAGLREEISACRLFALPSNREGFGLVFLEAMAQGRPCLGVRAGGVPEVISPDTGVLADYGDVPGIARTAVDAMRREWDEAAMLRRAREFSFEPFKAHLAGALSP